MYVVRAPVARGDVRGETAVISTAIGFAGNLDVLYNRPMSADGPTTRAAAPAGGALATMLQRPSPGHDVTLAPSALRASPIGTEPTDPGGRPEATAPSEPPIDDALAPGTMIHQFEIISLLGRGGMGQVYLARDTRLGRKVALKFLLTSSPELTQRFLIEARHTALCRHEHIVVVYEVDTHDDAPYMALEYLDGTSLADLIDGPMPIPRVVEILAAVTRALVRAHADGLVHCDLKPENIVITHDGGIKVLDFGIARLLDGDRKDEHICGTPRFMSPEQWGVDAIDHRTDLWAVGVIAWELLTGRHPLGNPTMGDLLVAMADLEIALPRLSSVAPGVPEALDHLIARCLVKRRDQRLASAVELLAALEALGPGRGRARPADQPPYPGMACFEEDDADRFFGRERDVAWVTSRLAEAPLVVLAGPSGVGKSSLLRAGVVPALKASGQAWTVLTLRPGRDPLHALAAAGATLDGDDHGLDADAARLLAEPGGFGARLRRHAHQRRTRVLVFVDQLEELFTLTRDPSVRAAFTAALAGASDDARAPVRVALSVRSDFLDRLDDDQLRDRLAEALLLLRPLGPAALRTALERPLDATGVRFESAAMIDDMIAQAGDLAGALPLLQFAAARLWDARDRERRLLTQAAYEAMGGIAGALASHAEDTVRQLSSAQRARLRTVLARLVTADGTRAVVDRAELTTLGPDVDAVVDGLIAARLLAVGGDGAATVELAHESLLRAWPTLRRWREEDGDDAALVAQIRTAALQWDQRDRPVGLLWTGAAIDDVRGLLQRHPGGLAPREYEFIDAGLALADRATRRRRRLAVGAFAALAALTAAALVVALWVRGAEQTAQAQRRAAIREATRARTAEEQSQAQLAAAQAAERARLAAEAERQRAQVAAVEAEGAKRTLTASLDRAEQKVEQSADDLQAANAHLRRALDQATADRRRAEEASRRAEALAAEAERGRAAERRRADEAERKATGLAKRLQ